MGLRGRAFLLLIGAVTCIVIYFTYILNSTSDSKLNKYNGIDEAIVQANDIPVHHKINDHHEQSIHDSLIASADDHPVFSPVKENTSLQIAEVGSAFIHEQSTVGFEDDYHTSRKEFLAQKVLSPIRNRKNKGMGYTTESIFAAQNKKDDKVVWRLSSDRNSSMKEKSSKRKQRTKDGDSFHREDRSDKIGFQSEMSEAKSIDIMNVTSREDKEELMTWKQRQEARFEEERKWLEDGKRRLLEEKIRFQQEMSQMMQELRRGSIVDVRQKLVSRPLRPVDPDQWEGLNNTSVDSRYPVAGEEEGLEDAVGLDDDERLQRAEREGGKKVTLDVRTCLSAGIVFLEGYKMGRPFVAPEDASAAGMQGQPQNIDEMLDSQAEERFFQLISEIHVDCVVIRRMGSLSDGGWDVCTVPPYVLQPRCIVYSFGINYDFTFDDAMANSFDCIVKAFDPSMSVGDHVRSATVQFYQLGLGAKNTVSSTGWKLNTFRHILKKLGHEKSVIDILKIDIEFYEWECLREMITDDSLHNVKQLMFEMHTPEVAMVQRPSTKEDFARMYGLLSDLERAGFRRYNVHMNPLGQYTSSRTGKTRSCCFELYYINIRFLK